MTKLNTPRGPLAIGLLWILLPLSGCFSLNRGAPERTHYVLGTGVDSGPLAEAARTESNRADATAPVIGLRSTELADYLRNPSIVVRRGAHQVGFSEFDQWGEPLARGVDRTLAGHLSARAPDRRVVRAPWPPGIRPSRLIQVHLLRFEGVAPVDSLDLSGESHLLARWEIIEPGDEVPLTSGVTEIRTPDWRVGDFAGLVAMLDVALDSLARDLVLGMDRIRTPPPTPGPP